jgi:hypothetical protein
VAGAAGFGAATLAGAAATSVAARTKSRLRLDFISESPETGGLATVVQRAEV